MEHSAPRMARVICTSFKSWCLKKEEKKVQVYGPGMHPRSLVHVTELEGSVCDGKTQFRAERKQSETATIHVANTMMSNDSMPYVAISAYPGIEIIQQYDFVILHYSSDINISM